MAFDQELDNWDTSNVTSMGGMFNYADSFNRPLKRWDTGNIEWEGATGFNQPLGSWDVSNVVSMASMFREVELFDQDISGWDVGNVTDISYMFAGSDQGGYLIGMCRMLPTCRVCSITRPRSSCHQITGMFQTLPT